MRTRATGGEPEIVAIIGWIAIVVALALAIGSAGCASVGERVVSIAKTTPWQDSDYSPEGSSAVAQYAQLRNAATHFGLRISEGEVPIEGAVGAFFPAGTPLPGPVFDVVEVPTIFILGTLPVDGRMETLAHELAHFFQPPGLSRSEAEVWAELVSVETQERLGYTGGVKRSGTYLAQHKMALYIAELYPVDIRKAADAIVNAALVKQP